MKHIAPAFRHPVHCAFPALPSPIQLPMMEIPEPSCGYFPERSSAIRAFAVSRMPGDLFHDFLDAGFRRSGRIIYQPVCRGCRACVPIRTAVATFRPSKSQRRSWRRNSDLTVSVAGPAATDEKFDLYRRYLAGRHADGRMERTREAFEEFLYESPVDTMEFTYRDSAGRLVAVGICDLCPRSLSSVYFYFDPHESRRGLGSYGVLFEIDFARRLGIAHYYPGYWIDGCSTMQYKTDFRPYELLGLDGAWRSPESSPENAQESGTEEA